MLRKQINNTFDNPNINLSNVISFLDFKHRKEQQGLYDINKYIRKAEVLDRLLKYEEAIVALEKAIELDPDYADAYIGKGTTLHQLGKYEEALEAYDKVIELKPDYAGAYP